MKVNIHLTCFIKVLSFEQQQLRQICHSKSFQVKSVAHTRQWPFSLSILSAIDPNLQLSKRF